MPDESTIFIITLPVIQHAVKVDLPRASSTRNAPPPDNMQLSIDAQGLFFLGKQTMDAAGLQIDQVIHTRSKIPAAPCPMPTHMVTMPYFFW